MWRYQFLGEDKSERRYRDNDFDDMLFEIATLIRFSYKSYDHNSYQDVFLYQNGERKYKIDGTIVSTKEKQIRKEINEIDDETYFDNLNNVINQLVSSDNIEDMIVGNIIYIWAM